MSLWYARGHSIGKRLAALAVGLVLLTAGGSSRAESKETKKPADEFIAGEYTTADIQGRFIVSGPGASKDGQTSWTLQSDVGPTMKSSAGWTTGPVAANPELANVKHADTLPEGLCYGRGSGRLFAARGKGTNIIGAKRVGNSISISIFVLNLTKNDGGKSAYQVDRVVVLTQKVAN